MRYFWDNREPPLTRVLLIESGSRSLLEGLIAHFQENCGPETPIDLLTCFGGLPAGFPPETVVYRVTDYATPEGRRQLIATLRKNDYSMAGMICSAEPVMTKWKLLLAARIPAKFFIINENGDYFWVHRENAATIREFLLIRMGLEGSGAVRTIGRILIFPFSVVFLLMYAFLVHARRRWRLLFHPQTDTQNP